MEEEISIAPTDSHRFFKVVPEIYEGIREYMDGEFGHPNGQTTSCLPPLQSCRRDINGNVLASVSNTEAAMAGDLLEDLLDAAQIEEVWREEWEADKAKVSPATE